MNDLDKWRRHGTGGRLHGTRMRALGVAIAGVGNNFAWWCRRGRKWGWR